MQALAMDPTPPPPQVPIRLTVAQLQVRWHCDRRTVLKMVAIGLPCMRLPFGYRFDAGDVEAFEQRHKLR
jgi:hypothetical protein